MPLALTNRKFAESSKGFVLEEKKMNIGKFEVVVGVISVGAEPDEDQPSIKSSS